jgi:hypothetical protein
VPVTLAGVHSDPAGDPQLREGGSHLDRGPAGTQRVVFVRGRHAEHRHHGVADELLDRSPVRLDDPLHPLEIPGEQRPKRLRVRRLSELGRPGHVAEQDRHHLALLARGGLDEWGSALGAELERRL